MQRLLLTAKAALAVVFAAVRRLRLSEPKWLVRAFACGALTVTAVVVLMVVG